MSVEVPRQPHRRSRRLAPTHIALPTVAFSPPSKGSPKDKGQFKHTYPATPGTRSLTPATERRNPFFILSEDDSPPSRSAPRTPPARRPVLPTQVSLDHAFGFTRSTPQPRDDHSSGTSADSGTSSCPPSKSKGRKELVVPSPIVSRSPSRCSIVSEVRSHPEVSLGKKKKTRPRSRTVMSEESTPGIRWSLETPSFRSSACGTPDAAGTHREISLSEMPMFSTHHIGRPVDIFGLAVIQPPRMVPRRPRIAQRHTVAAVSTESARVPGKPDAETAVEHRGGKVKSKGSRKESRRPKTEKEKESPLAAAPRGRTDETVPRADGGMGPASPQIEGMSPQLGISSRAHSELYSPVG
jgi:hypothetical protein